MLKSSSFDPKLYNQLKSIVALQKDMSQIKIDNISQIRDSILNQKNIIENKEGVKFLAQCFNDLADSHPKSIEQLVDLFILLQQNQSSTNYLHLLQEYIVMNIHTKEKLRSSFLFFLRYLLVRKAIKIDSIINEINLLLPPKTRNEDQNKNTTALNHTNSSQKQAKANKNDNDNDSNEEEEEIQDFSDDEDNENLKGKLTKNEHAYYYLRKKIMRTLNWFYPEINLANKFLIQQMKSELIYSPLSEFKELDPQQLNLMMNTGYSTDKLATIIRNDDIDSFLKIVSESSGQFNIDQTIKSTKFERTSILSHDPSLIQYAAFFNSLKIFKYLYLNKADIETNNYGMYSLLHFAICGGSIEIVHILEQNDFELFSGIPISIKYFQNDILSWLLENHFPTTADDFDLMGYNKFISKGRYSCVSKEISDDDDNDDDCYHPKKYEYDYYHLNDIVIEDNENDEKFDNGRFEFFNFDVVFQTIMETNNYLALFILFDFGMNINSRNDNSKKTLLHYAIQKGKFFFFKLLLSNDFINPLMKDKYGEGSIIYSVKFTRERFFYYMIKNNKILSNLSNNDYIKMVYYADSCELKDICAYLLKNWKIDLLSLIDSLEIRTFCDAMTFLPLQFFSDQIESFLNESFKSHKFVYFSILANRILTEKSLIVKGKFYFYDQKKKKEVGKSFIDFCQLLLFFRANQSKINYYDKYKFYLTKNQTEIGLLYSRAINIKNNQFTLSSGENSITICEIYDSNFVNHSEISIDHSDEESGSKKFPYKRKNK